MGLLIDTSVFIAYERARRGLDDLLDSLGDEPVALASITASELLHGVERAEGAVRRAARQGWVEAVLAALPIYAFDLETTRFHARIWADLAASGRSIGAHDLLIAATARRHGYGVLTGNAREFVRVDGLPVKVVQT